MFCKQILLIIKFLRPWHVLGYCRGNPPHLIPSFLGHVYVSGWTEKFIGWLRRSWATAMKLGIYALQSTFPDTYCIVFSLIKSTLDKYFMTLKISTRDISKRPGKLTKSCFTRIILLLHKPVVAMAAVRNCGFELVDYAPYSPDLAPTIFCSTTWKKRLTG